MRPVVRELMCVDLWLWIAVCLFAGQPPQLLVMLQCPILLEALAFDLVTWDLDALLDRVFVFEMLM